MTVAADRLPSRARRELPLVLEAVVVLASIREMASAAETLRGTVGLLMSGRKGILAADESVGTAGKRLASIGKENTEENRRRMREWILGAPGLAEYVSGVILFDETLRQRVRGTDTPFVDVLADAGIVVGIKVDKGTVPLRTGAGCAAGAARPETVTTGLDGLEGRPQGSVPATRPRTSRRRRRPARADPSCRALTPTRARAPAGTSRLGAASPR